jgi:hypothetical protein
MNYTNRQISDFDYYLTITLKGNVVDRADELNIGGLTFIRKDKTYVLDQKWQDAEYNEHRDITIVKCTFPDKHYDVLEDGTKYNEEFPECKFDLSLDGIMGSSYKVLWIDGGLDDAEIVDISFHAEYRNKEGVLTNSLNARVLEWSEYEELLNNKSEPEPEYIEYNGKKYKTRELTMIEEGWGEVTRLIAGEDLYDAITKNGEDDSYMEDDTSEEYEIDSRIYHYIPVEDLDKSGEYICKNSLDMEFEFIQEEG